MARDGSPDDPNYSESDPTQYANYGGTGGHAYSEYQQSGYGPPTGYGQAPPPEPTPWYRKPAALVGLGVLTAIVLALLVYAVVKFTGNSGSSPAGTSTTSSASSTANSSADELVGGELVGGAGSGPGWHDADGDRVTLDQCRGAGHHDRDAHDHPHHDHHRGSVHQHVHQHVDEHEYQHVGVHLGQHRHPNRDDHAATVSDAVPATGGSVAGGHPPNVWVMQVFSDFHLHRAHVRQRLSSPGSRTAPPVPRHCAPRPGMPWW